MTHDETATNVLPTQDEDPKTLSEANIRAAAPGKTLWDATVKGLHCRCFATKKVFYLYYRTKAGQQRKPQLGNWGSITLAQARKIAKDMLGEVAAGKDPGHAIAEARSAPTMTDLWDEFWKRHASKKKSSLEDERQWKKFIKPKLGSMKLADITYTDVADLHESMADTETQANRTLALMSTMFAFAMHPLEWLEKNPAAGVARFKEKKRKRYMKAAEAIAVAERLRIEAATNPASVAFLWLLILTGARRGEIAKARWDQIHGDKIVLSEHKTDQKGEARIIHLPPAAKEILNGLPKTKGTITGILSPTKLWQKIRTDAKCPDLRIHDLRHSFASAGISAGMTLAEIGELLGHSSTETTKRYAHLVDEAGAKAAAKIGGNIAAAMGISSSCPPGE